jgi:hypothetical protein
MSSGDDVPQPGWDSCFNMRYNSTNSNGEVGQGQQLTPKKGHTHVTSYSTDPAHANRISPVRSPTVG